MFNTISEIKSANKANGHHFFDASSMRFFDSRILRGVRGGRYFVTSERYDERSARLYTVRMAQDDGTIDTVGAFQAYASAREARAAIRAILDAK